MLRIRIEVLWRLIELLQFTQLGLFISLRKQDTLGLSLSLVLRYGIFGMMDRFSSWSAPFFGLTSSVGSP